LDDATGGLGEDVPFFALLCREFEDFKLSYTSTNVQQQSNIIVTAVVQQSLMEPRNPLGESGGPLRSQVRDENPRATG